MSTPTRRSLPLVLCSLAVLAAGPLAAQDSPDLLDRARRLREVEAQRVEKEFQDARVFAYRLVRSEPGRLATAQARIRDTLGQVQDDTSLDPQRRALLVRTLKWDLDNLGAEVARRSSARAPDRVPQAIDGSARGIRDARQAERRQSHQEAASIMDARARQIADARGDRRLSGERFIGVQRGIETSATAPASDYDFPPDWLEKSKRRSPAAKLAPQERALLTALNQPLSVDFKEETFTSVLDYLQKKAGLSIAVDRQALAEVMVTYDSLITLRLQKVSTRTVLKRLLADLNLAYYIKDGTIQVTSIARAREMVVARAYYIGDLVSFINPFLPPALNQLQMAQTIQTIMNTIQAQVDPQSWRTNNPEAAGTITYDPITMSLIIKQTAEVHSMLGGGH
jgi:hypothetical protein